MKLAIIHTAKAVIYTANGKVTIVKCRSTGRFLKRAKFARIIDNLFSLAKNAITKGYSDNIHKLNVQLFQNMAKMAKTVLGLTTVYFKRNFAVTGFDMVRMGIFAGVTHDRIRI